MRRRCPREPNKKKEKKWRIGDETGLLDMNKNSILFGDYIKLKNTNYDGPVLYNKEQGKLGICFGLWYGDLNPYNEQCYGKFIAIPKDNGMRMELIPIKQSEAEYDRYVLNRRI